MPTASISVITFRLHSPDRVFNQPAAVEAQAQASLGDYNQIMPGGFSRPAGQNLVLGVAVRIEAHRLDQWMATGEILLSTVV